MTSAYAHQALLDYPRDVHEGSVGATVTVALCGHWEHEPPCPLAPHHTTASRTEGGLAVRILFASAPEHEQEVRQRIAAALSAGTGPTLDGGTVSWRLLSHGPSAVAADEAERAVRLAEA